MGWGKRIVIRQILFFFYENGFRSIVRSIIVHVVSIELLTSSYLPPTTHWEIEAVGYLGGRLQRISLSGG